MASDKFMMEYSLILERKQMYVDNMKGVLSSSMPDEDKKNVLIVFCRKVNELIMDARKIYYDTKSSNREVEFEKSKQVLKDCIALQSKIYENVINLETNSEMAIRYGIGIKSNDGLIEKISNEYISSVEKTK